MGPNRRKGGENKPFAALIESLTLAAALSRQGNCLFTIWPFLGVTFLRYLISISRIEPGIKQQLLVTATIKSCL